MQAHSCGQSLQAAIVQERQGISTREMLDAGSILVALHAESLKTSFC